MSSFQTMPTGPISTLPTEKFALNPVPERKKATIVQAKLLGLQIEVLSTGKLANQQVLVLEQQKADESHLKLATQIATERSASGKPEAFALFKLDTVVQLFVQWRQNMPRVRPFFAVKCNNDPVLVATLAAMGAGFDCASREEIDLIMDNGFGRPSDIVYANTCKTPEFIEHAEKRGIRHFTFDCVEELAKMKAATHNNPQMLLRIDVTDQSATRPLGVKFGCDPVADAPRLLAVGKQMGMEIVGISFHVGSGCKNPLVYRQAIAKARELFTLGEELGHQMRVLDLGGGFPGYEEERPFFEQVSQVICQALEEFFPAESMLTSPQRKISTDSGLGMDNGDEPDMEEDDQQFMEEPMENQLQIIAEPGRYFAGSPSAVCARVIGATHVSAQKLTNKEEDEHKSAYMYYLDDGLYGSFSCLSSYLYTKKPHGIAVHVKKQEKVEEFLSVVWGPTCDSRDQIELCTKPRLQLGDYLFYSDMGAYTRVTATNFNGFKLPKDTYYIVGDQTWKLLTNLMAEMKGAAA